MDKQEEELFVGDARSILKLHTNSRIPLTVNKKVAKSELVSSLRNTGRGCAWFGPESGRRWKMSARFINYEMDEILEQDGINVEHQRSKPNQVGNTTILRTYFSI